MYPMRRSTIVTQRLARIIVRNNKSGARTPGSPRINCKRVLSTCSSAKRCLRHADRILDAGLFQISQLTTHIQLDRIFELLQTPQLDVVVDQRAAIQVAVALAIERQVPGKLQPRVRIVRREAKRAVLVAVPIVWLAFRSRRDRSSSAAILISRQRSASAPRSFIKSRRWTNAVTMAASTLMSIGGSPWPAASNACLREFHQCVAAGQRLLQVHAIHRLPEQQQHPGPGTWCRGRPARSWPGRSVR